jgi:hypothetical protein
MKELELTRTPQDRRLYTLEGVGTIRLAGMFSKNATAQTAVDTWRITCRGFWKPIIEATDAAGVIVGEYMPRDIRRGGTLRWADRELTLGPISALRERYALREQARDLAVLDGKSWGKRPVKLTLPDPDAIAPDLLLFAAFIVHRLAVNADSAAAGSTAAISASTSS